MSDFTIAIFVNPQAGTGKHRVIESELSKFLIKEQIVFVIYDQSWPATLGDFTHLFVIGGDGTLNHFLNTYPDTKIPISLFKAGSGNDFAWKLYGRNSLNQQLYTALNGIPYAIDAGICNGRIFINGVGIGFDGAVVKNLIGARKWLSGSFAYYWTVLRTISGYKSRHLRFSLPDDGRKLQGRTFMVTVANGSRFGGNFMVAPQSSLTDQQLDLVIIDAVTVLKRYYYLPKMKKGRHIGLPFVKTSTLKSVSIESETPVAAHLDGELMVASKFDIKILPGRFLFRH